MPRHYRKKLGRKKRLWTKSKSKPKLKITRNIGLKPATHYFKRRVQIQVNPTDLNTFPSNMGYTDEGNIYWNTAFALSELPNYSDFTNLFASYKINAVGIEVAPHINITSWGSAQSLMIRTKWNQTGRAFGASTTTDDMLQIQALRRHILPRANNKPLKLFMKTRQLSMIYEGPASTGYSTVYPKYVSTDEPNVPHEGMLMYISPVSNNVITSTGVSFPILNIIFTYYLSCRAVF